MKRITSILHKLTSLTEANESPSAIDWDLMLDYTRQLYDSLLSERLGAIPPSEPLPNQEEEITGAVPLQEEQTPSENTQTNGLLETQPEEHGSESIPDNQEENLQDIEEELYHQRSNISFEPPHPSEEPPSFLERGIEEDEPEGTAPPLQEIPVPLPEEEEEESPADYAQIFNYNAPSSKSTDNSNQRGDIRKQIGINDKYLFLNELFYNQKQAYEEALNKLNTMPDYEEALSWITNEIAPTYNWDEHDETVQDFYEALVKHFSAR